jgi:hypothetical protein
MHIIVIITNVALMTPECLYNVGERPLVLSLDEIQVECRNTEIYQGNWFDMLKMRMRLIRYVRSFGINKSSKYYPCTCCL